MKTNLKVGHSLALFTILIWGTTYISTKILLESFVPIEILLYRFFIGLFILFIIYPKKLTLTSKKHELVFMLAGLSGVCLYFLLEIIALNYTLASNVGVIVCTTPFFTAMFSRLFIKQDNKLSFFFYIGFLIAMAGICFISFHGISMKMNPIGDILAFVASMIWALYSVITKKISNYGYHTILYTRRIFTYGLLFLLPIVLFFQIKINYSQVIRPINLLNLLYLGILASALCFVTWNTAVNVLGALKTTIYIYLVPVIVVLTSAIILHEPITIFSAIGTCLAFLGLVLSEYKS